MRLACWVQSNKKNLAGLSRAQKKQSSELTEISTKTRKISNWVMPSAFICIKMVSQKKIKKILGKAIRVFESPTMYLIIWVICRYIQKSLLQLTISSKFVMYVVFILIRFDQFITLEIRINKTFKKSIQSQIFKNCFLRSKSYFTTKTVFDNF